MGSYGPGFGLEIASYDMGIEVSKATFRVWA